MLIVVDEGLFDPPTALRRAIPEGEAARIETCTPLLD
jgi:hypothetical protein